MVIQYFHWLEGLGALKAFLSTYLRLYAVQDSQTYFKYGILTQI